jgi:hypothetical protein
MYRPHSSDPDRASGRASCWFWPGGGAQHDKKSQHDGSSAEEPTGDILSGTIARNQTLWGIC